MTMRFGRYLPIILPPSLLAGAVVLAWEFAVRAWSVPPYVLPAPTRILAAFAGPQTTLGSHLWTTTVEALCGFVIGSAFALPMGLLLATSERAQRALLPFVVGSNAVPIIAVAPLVVMWLGHGLASKAAVAAFLCFFPLCINTFRGVQAADEALKDLFHVFGATRPQFLLLGRIPAALPYIFTGAKLNAVYAVIGAIVAEFIGATSGLGYGMVHASYSLDTPRLWAYLVTSVLLGMSFCAIVAIFEYWYARRHG